MKKVILIICTIAVFFSLLAAPVSATSFTHIDVRGGTESVSTREMYEANNYLTADKLGLQEDFEGLTDICVGQDGKIYIICGGEGKSRTVVISSDYSSSYELLVKDENGAQVDYSGAQGIFADKNGDIYIADTNNAQVLVLNKYGEVIDRIYTPESDLIPDDFEFQPSRVIKDNRNYLYILSLGCYYGALSFTPEGEFLGFYGANTVNASALDTLSFLWDKLVGNDTKKAYSAKVLPYSFVDFSVDPDNFLVTCTGSTGLWTMDNGSGQIRVISSNGADILYNKCADGTTTSATSFNFMENKVVLHNSTPKTQNLVSIDSDSNGVFYALDQTYGYIYVYDAECNLINAFAGGSQAGERLGDFKKAVSLAVNGDDILVADQENRAITVFKRTPYGQLLYSAQCLYLDGDYTKAEPFWQQILSQDAGNQLAYRGLAMASYGRGDYNKALQYAEAGLDLATYDLAWQAILADNSAKYFVWIALLSVIVIVSLVWVTFYSRKKRLAFVCNGKIYTFFKVISHPFDSFSNIKYKGQGSLIIGILLTILLYVSVVVQNTKSGFLYCNAVAGDYNSLFTLLQTVGLILLWSLANWLVCSMFSGKGYLHEVFVGTIYSFTPLIITTFLRVVLSHFIPLTASGILTGLSVVGWIYSLFLLCIAMMTIHEYDFFKFLSTLVGVIFFMIVAVFVIIFLLTMLTLVKEFIVEIYEEIAFR